MLEVQANWRDGAQDNCPDLPLLSLLAESTRSQAALQGTLALQDTERTEKGMEWGGGGEVKSAQTPSF